jgi:amino acid transporter
MYITGQMAQYSIVVGNLDFNAQPWQCWLFVVAFCGGGAFLNTVGAKHLALMEVVVAAMFVLGYAANVIVLWVMAPHNSASAVFSTFQNGTGWANFGFGILTSQTQALYLLIGSDGAAHMAEETQEASLNVPRGIIGSYCIGAASGLLMLITFAFAYTPQALNSDVYHATYFAFMAVYETATGSAGGTQALTAIIIVLTFFSATNFMASASRQTYAFARDGGLPFSKYVCRVRVAPNG